MCKLFHLKIRRRRRVVKSSKIILDRSYVVGKIDNRLFGSFVEHLGRCVYEGLYEPSHPLADELGFRKDVLDMVRDLGISLIRYPGGNFVSGFHWEDSVGPVSQRPRRLDLAWKTTESNEVGLHEFAAFCKKAGASLMYSVNLGTRGADDARNVVEYANHAGGTYWSDLRIKNGAEKPFGIPLWCLGNEMDAAWQTGQKSAQEYGRLARESAKVMKLVDPGIELVVCGSTGPVIETFGDWELTVLDECYDYVDYVSLHRYYENPEHDTASFLANTLDMEDFIHTVACICDTVKGKKHRKKKLNLSFDEWNVWYHTKGQDEELIAADRWGQALPLLQDVYNFEDALVVGLMLITLLKHADRIKISCLAQLVNVIAPIMTEKGGGAWAQTIFYPFMHVAKYAKDTDVLMTLIDTPLYDCKKYTSVPYLDGVAVMAVDAQTGACREVTLFCVSRDPDEEHTVTLDLRSFGSLSLKEHILLHHDNVNACNTQSDPFRVAPAPGPGGTVEDQTVVLRVPALSWNVFRFTACEQKFEQKPDK